MEMSSDRQASRFFNGPGVLCSLTAAGTGGEGKKKTPWTVVIVSVPHAPTEIPVARSRSSSPHWSLEERGAHY